LTEIYSSLSEDFIKCAEFHGHICPGLTIGYRAAQEALERLKEERSADEEIVAIVETDACCVDAIQVLTGCTFGKGNLIFRDYGKMVFYFLSRHSKKCVRLSMKPSSIGKPDSEEEGDHEEIHLQHDGKYPEFKPEITRDILQKPIDEIFEIKEVAIDIPLRAKIEISELCDVCHEPAMPSKMTVSGDIRVCQECRK